MPNASAQSLALTALGDDAVDEFIEAGPLAHGHDMTCRALAVCMCKCRECNRARRSYGMPCRGCRFKICRERVWLLALVIEPGVPWPFLVLRAKGRTLLALLAHRM
jgi:hypothetical protein